MKFDVNGLISEIRKVKQLSYCITLALGRLTISAS